MKLTIEQKVFIEKHHNLIYAFLNKNNLREDDFYDILVFGFLKAVIRYFKEPDLSEKYAFSTIAWGAMKTSLLNYYRNESRLKRKVNTISLEANVYGNGEILSLNEILSGTDSLMIDFETELMLLELATTRTALGAGYLYPLLPFDGKALSRLLIRRRIHRDNVEQKQ